MRWNSGLRVSVTCTFPRVIRLIQETWGGTIRDRGAKTRKHKYAYEWELGGDHAALFLRDIVLWLLEKGKQADTALSMYALHHADPSASKLAIRVGDKALRRMKRESFRNLPSIQPIQVFDPFRGKHALQSS